MFVRAMKVLVLMAGALGVIGFFEPFFDYGNDLPISPYRIARGFSAEELGMQDQPARARSINDEFQYEHSADPTIKNERHSPVPYYFLSALAFMLIGLGAVFVGRFTGIAALFSLMASLLALGGWMREFRVDRDIVREGGHAMMTSGSSLLLVSGLLGLVASIVVLARRDPGRPKPPPPPPVIPEARLVR
jgi:hypothetical protein